MEGKSLAVLVLSGNQEGRILPLLPGEEILIGRMDGLDLVLPEDLVSRRHACIEVDEEGAVLRDLGSTNGTFVNGKRIREVMLSEGDRILLGATILSVVPHEEMLLPSGGSLTEVLAAISAGPAAEDGPDLAAVVEEVDAPAAEDATDVDATEAHGAEDASGAGETGVPVAEVTGAGDEELPGADAGEEVEGLPRDARLALAEGAPPLRELDARELDVFQSALVHGSVERILEQAGDVQDAPALLQGLVDKGYLVIEV